MSIIGSFVIPIEAYSNGADLPQIIILSAMFAAPSLVSVYLGKIVDKKPTRTLIVGFLLIASSLAGLIFAKGFVFYLILIFTLSIAINLASLAITNFTTKITPKSYYVEAPEALTTSGRNSKLTQAGNF